VENEAAIPYSKTLIESIYRVKTDARLVAQVKLVSIRLRAFNELRTMDHSDFDAIGRYMNSVRSELNVWFKEWSSEMGRKLSWTLVESLFNKLKRQ